MNYPYIWHESITQIHNNIFSLQKQCFTNLKLSLHIFTPFYAYGCILNSKLNLYNISVNKTTIYIIILK